MRDSNAAAGRGEGDPRPSAFHTIVYGGLAVGVLDAIAAMANAWFSGGVAPVRVWQYVASSVIGGDAFTGGISIAALGLFFHFCVAFGVATAFYVLARFMPVLIRYAVVAGAIYGVVVYFVMSYVIVPMTLARQGAFNWYGLVSGLLIHMLFVGLPVALITRRYASNVESRSA